MITTASWCARIWRDDRLRFRALSHTGRPPGDGVEAAANPRDPAACSAVVDRPASPFRQRHGRCGFRARRGGAATAPTSLALAGLAIAALVPMHAARAAETSHAAAARHDAADKAGATHQLSRQLSTFTRKTTPIRLKGASSSKSLMVRIPPDAHAVQAMLHLKGTNSGALASGASELVLRLNGATFAQVPLKGDTTQFDQKIKIPAKLLHPGDNILTFLATQSTGHSCEPFDAPQLWTQIAPDSTVDVAYRTAPTRLSFDEIRALFGGDGISSVSKQLILYDKSLARAPEPIMAAARAVARLHGDQPIRVLARPLDKLQSAIAQTFPGGVILLHEGTPGGEAAGGPKRVVFDLQRNAAGNPELSVTGPSSAAIAHAVRLLGERHVAWPNASRVTVTVPASPQKQTAGSTAKPDLTSFTLKQAGFPAQTVHGRKGAFPPLSFWDPEWNSHAILHLHMAYSAGAGSGSMMQAVVNGTMVGTIPLSSASGGSYPDYKLLIPKNVLRVGENRLVLRTVFHAPSASHGACPSQDNGSSLGVTLFSDSHLAILGGSRVTPDHLSAIAHGLYPIHTIAVTAPSGPLFSAAATLGAKLAQINGGQHLRLITKRMTAPDAGTIVLGPESQIPAPVLKAIGLTPSRGNTQLSEASTDGNDSAHSATDAVAAWLHKHLRRNAHAEQESARTHTKTQADPVAVGNFAKATVMAFADGQNMGSGSDQAPPVVVTGATDQDLENAAFAFVRRSSWEQIHGRAVIADPGSSHLQVLPASSEPLETSAQLGYLASRYPIIAIIVIVAGFAFFIVVIRALVSLRRRRRHPSVKGVDDR